MKYQINQRIGFATMGEIKPPQAANGVHFFCSHVLDKDDLYNAFGSYQ